MPINVSAALDRNTSHKVWIVSTLPGDYIDGLWVEGKAKRVKALASDTQPKTSDIKSIPALKGESVERIKKFVINKKVETSDEENQKTADTITSNKYSYKVVEVQEFSNYGYWVAFGVRQK